MQDTPKNHPPLIYNLFPPLVGEVDKWMPHVERAADMGFNWCFLNPIHLVGASGSLYAIRDYFAFSPTFFPESEPAAQRARFASFVEEAREHGVEIMVDLVINHTAYDNPLTRDHRNWYKLNDDGSIKNPGAHDDSAPGGYTVWGDLNEIDNEHSQDRNNLWEYWWRVVEMFLKAGVRGFRCDAAYQIPTDLWRMLIGRAKEQHPETKFFAESLGCPLKQTIDLARKGGHDYVFNSGKWWDYKSDWFLDQQKRMANQVSSICFPESHDTQRLCNEWNNDLDRIKQHYLFSAMISTGVLIPIGFEYGFRKELHVVHTNPFDYEGAHWDMTDMIRDVNALKCKYRVLHEDSHIEQIDSGNHQILALKKTSLDGEQQVLLLFNRRDGEEEVDLRHVMGQAGLKPLASVDGGKESPQRMKLQRYGMALLGL